MLTGPFQFTRHSPLPCAELLRPLLVVHALPAQQTRHERTDAALERTRRIRLTAHCGLKLAPQPSLQLVEITDLQCRDVERHVVVVPPTAILRTELHAVRPIERLLRRRQRRESTEVLELLSIVPNGAIDVRRRVVLHEYFPLAGPLDVVE